MKQNPLETLRKFEPGPDEEYQLGKGDEITVNFAGRPEMQAKLVVGPDGRITLPLAGDIMLAGLTRPEAAKAIESGAGELLYESLGAGHCHQVHGQPDSCCWERSIIPGVLHSTARRRCLKFWRAAESRQGRTNPARLLTSIRFPSVALSIEAATRWYGWS